ncbi:Cutinase transcription factor 1 beta [Madurella mycetomatis]|uniref:Cutinase transcription factor 1 beta n=1 Tax=Madurella mycetomatis TaxID=100816 RepID=A0A175VVE7_9PEZI|nr:Cutinase transcription factor 1 beta [Madurella mycetomatis]
MASELPPTGAPTSPPRVPAPAPEPSVVKLTRGHSCVLCQQRKVRCDKQKPCANCVKAQVECRVVPPQPPRRRKKKPHERDLIDRLRKYESLLSQHGVSFEPIAHDLKPLESELDVAELEQEIIGLKTSPSSGTDQLSPDHAHDKSVYRGADDESSDEEGPTLNHAYDTVFDSNDGFPFIVGGSRASVKPSHPSPIQIFQLWQIYISNVNPLLKITHTPTLQAQIISAGANTAKIPEPLEVLMFAIYFSAVTSMSDEEVHSTFDEDKAVLLGRYHNATQQALVNAGFMRSDDLMVLQALLLYLLCARPYVDPRSLFCLIGIAVRIAVRLNLHRDGALLDPPEPPFQAEQKRRLWWQIVIFDKRVAEITGQPITALSSCGGDTRPPLNINDADLNIQAKSTPNQYSGPTEMVFCLTRVELTLAVSPDAIRRTVTTPGGGTRHHPMHQPRIHFSPSSPDVVQHVANQHMPNDLPTFCSYMENYYLKHCDTKVPLHFFTLLMTRIALSKLRIIDFLLRTREADNVDQNERDAFFMEAIRMVEMDNMLQSADMLQGFRWYTYQHFPLPAYLFLVSELRHRTTGDLCERAWNVMIENHERRGMLRRNFRSPLHIAYGHFFIKAWDAREAAEMQLGRSLPTPKIVQMLRSNAAKTKRPAAPHPQHPVADGMQQAILQPIGPRSGSGMSTVIGDVSTSPPGLPQQTGMYPGKPMPDSATAGPPPQQMGGGVGGTNGLMMNDTSMMYTGYADSANTPMYGTASTATTTPLAMQDVDMTPMDWNTLLQFGTYGGFNPGGGGFNAGFYAQGTGTSG